MNPDSRPADPSDRLPNALTREFANRLNELIAISRVDEEEIKKMNTEKLHKLLLDSSPEISISERNVHRLRAGKAVPRLDVIVALARVLNTSPHNLVPEVVPVDDQQTRRR